MRNYIIRKAKEADIPFLAEAVIAGEKGITDKCNYMTLFNLTEDEATKNIIAMFEEEIEGCEFSLGNYYIAEYENQPVASFGGWIEAFNDWLPSKILKSNLINFVFSKESIDFLKSKSDLIQDLSIDRTPYTLQLEYLYVTVAHRGERLPSRLINTIEECALKQFPNLTICEFQLFANNIRIIHLFENHGYRIVNSFKSTNPEILRFLPSNEKLVMAKEFSI